MFKVTKKAQKDGKTLNIFKVNQKDTRKIFGASIINLEHIFHFILLSLLLTLNKLMPVGAAKLKFQTKNFSVILGYIVFYGWENLLGCMFSFLFTQHEVAKG